MTILRVRRKPIETEAMQFDGTKDDALAIAEWAGKSVRPVARDHEWHLEITKVGGGYEVAKEGDYVIMNKKGNPHACKGQFFESIYEVTDG